MRVKNYLLLAIGLFATIATGCSEENPDAPTQGTPQGVEDSTGGQEQDPEPVENGDENSGEAAVGNFTYGDESYSLETGWPMTENEFAEMFCDKTFAEICRMELSADGSKGEPLTTDNVMLSLNADKTMTEYYETASGEKLRELHTWRYNPGRGSMVLDRPLTGLDAPACDFRIAGVSSGGEVLMLRDVYMNGERTYELMVFAPAQQVNTDAYSDAAPSVMATNVGFEFENAAYSVPPVTIPDREKFNAMFSGKVWTVRSHYSIYADGSVSDDCSVDYIGAGSSSLRVGHDYSTTRYFILDVCPDYKFFSLGTYFYDERSGELNHSSMENRAWTLVGETATGSLLFVTPAMAAYAGEVCHLYVVDGSVSDNYGKSYDTEFDYSFIL